MARHTDNSTEVPALNTTGAWSRLTAPLPLPISLRGWLRDHTWGRSAAWQSVVRQSELPAAVQQRIALIVRKTRLWPSERADVARELCAHFADGIAMGASADVLCSRFGEAKPAARLIRAAKRRGRPLWWQVWHYGARGVACLLGIMLATYAVLAVMFFASTPNVKRNYTAEINAKILATPEQSRAWPIYLAAMRGIGHVPLDLMTSLQKPGERRDPEKREDMWPQRPGDERWPMAAAWVNSKQKALEQVRHAAGMEHLGFTLADQLPEEYRMFQAERSGTPITPALPSESNPMLMSILLPYLGDFRNLARTFMVDARIAIQEQDADRLVADVKAMCGLARQCVEINCLINALVQAAILTVAIDITKEALPSEMLKESHLRDLAHTIGAFNDTTLHASVRMEKDFVYDVVQRMYSDNGSGDGHMTHAGFKYLESIGNMQQKESGLGDETLVTAAGPLSVAGMASRKDLLSETDRLFAMSEREGDVPLWERSESQVSIEIEQMNASVVSRTRYMPLIVLLPAFSVASSTIEQARQTRDGALAAIAVESFKRTHGKYPASLDALTPGLLPRIPPDRYDGAAIKYRLIGEGLAARPVLYSIGVDRVDDGGHRPKSPTHSRNMFVFKPREAMSKLMKEPKQHDLYSGDWILYGPG